MDSLCGQYLDHCCFILWVINLGKPLFISDINEFTFCLVHPLHCSGLSPLYYSLWLVDGQIYGWMDRYMNG